MEGAERMSEDRDNYAAYLLRLWRSGSEEGTEWRASLEDAHTGEMRGFGTADALIAFLMERMRRSDSRDADEVRI